MQSRFGSNFHVRHAPVLQAQRQRLVVIKGGTGSRLLERAALLCETGQTRSGHPLHILSTAAREIFGTFGGWLSVQRGPPRRVEAPFAMQAAAYVRSLP